MRAPEKAARGERGGPGATIGATGNESEDAVGETQQGLAEQGVGVEGIGRWVDEGIKPM